MVTNRNETTNLLPVILVAVKGADIHLYPPPLLHIDVAKYKIDLLRWIILLPQHGLLTVGLIFNKNSCVCVLNAEPFKSQKGFIKWWNICWAGLIFLVLIDICHQV